jgi:hypothetical protein
MHVTLESTHPAVAIDHQMLVVFKSGSVRYPVPEHANMVIDVCTLPNPTRYNGELDLKLPGFHPAIKPILEANGQAERFFTTTVPVVDGILTQMRDNGDTYVVIVFRCEGALHRSVYCARRFAEHFAACYKWLNVREVHPALGAEASTSPESSEDAPQSGSEQPPIMYTYHSDTNTLHVQEVARQSNEDRQKMLRAGLDKIKERRKQHKK